MGGGEEPAELEVEGAAQVAVDEADVRATVLAALREVGFGGQPLALGVQFVSDGRMRELNVEHRGKDAVTDVLSFPIDALDTLPPGVQRQLGDVVIDADEVARRAADAGEPAARQLTRTVVHGVLHLAGLDHETDAGAMLEREDALLETLAPIGWARG
jgi:probable rRNA maturation factor